MNFRELTGLDIGSYICSVLIISCHIFIDMIQLKTKHTHQDIELFVIRDGSLSEDQISIGQEFSPI